MIVVYLCFLGALIIYAYTEILNKVFNTKHTHKIKIYIYHKHIGSWYYALSMDTQGHRFPKLSRASTAIKAKYKVVNKMYPKRFRSSFDASTWINHHTKTVIF